MSMSATRPTGKQSRVGNVEKKAEGTARLHAVLPAGDFEYLRERAHQDRTSMTKVLCQAIELLRDAQPLK